tara:strand:- start:957 stop:2093 length:1137 start_codon:yes stop_codon:yes gene_type:complete
VLLIKLNILKLIYIIKKKLQLLFKKFSYGLFKLLYGEIRDFKPLKNDLNSKLLASQIDNQHIYKVYVINKARLYTDTINDTAIIQDDKIIEGPSFQIRKTKFDEINKNIVLTKGTPRFKKKIKGKIFSLLTGGAGNNNYWHWLFDVLPRFKILENTQNLKDINYFLLPNLKNRFQIETLDIIGIPKKKRLSSLKQRHIECDQIIVSDHPYVIKNDASNEIQNLPMWIISWLNSTLTKDKALDDKSFPANIYIDRSDAHPNVANLRQIINEKDVVNFLKERGFNIITLSNYTFKDQMKLFYNAKNIVGLHGAGFANVIFSKPELKVLELKPSSAGKMCENLIKKCDINYDCISVKPEKFDLNNQMGHIKVNLNELKKKL